MIIQVDQEGWDVIEQFCVMAIQAGGKQNLKQMNLVRNSMWLLTKPTPTVVIRQPKQSQQPEQPEQSEPKE